MKKYIIVSFSFLLFSCSESAEVKSNDIEATTTKEQVYLEDFDFQQVIKLDNYIKRELIKGTINTHQKFITEQIISKTTYCNILHTNSLEGDLLKYIEAKCERTKHFQAFVSKYPKYLKLDIKDQISIKAKAEKLLSVDVSSEEAFNLFNSRKTSNNES